MKGPVTYLGVSNTAYPPLVEAARAGGYVQHNAINARGLNEYIIDLMRANPTIDCWIDTRPSHMKEANDLLANDPVNDRPRRMPRTSMRSPENSALDKTERPLAAGMFPQWLPNRYETDQRNDRRFLRALVLPPSTLEQMRTLAFRLGIIEPNRPHYSINAASPTSLAGALLEVIGRGYLTPVVKPARAVPKRYRIRRQPKELAFF